MSKNITTISSKRIFREYLLGQSFLHGFIRLSFILTIIGLIWCGLSLLLNLHIQYQKKKQLVTNPSTSIPVKKVQYQFTLITWKRRKENSFPDDQLQNFHSSPPHTTQPSHTSDQTLTCRSAQELRHSLADLPLVMITDTNSSHTNIVELETFDDQTQTIINDRQRQIIRQFKASYRPRFST